MKKNVGRVSYTFPTFSFVQSGISAILFMVIHETITRTLFTSQENLSCIHRTWIWLFFCVRYIKRSCDSSLIVIEWHNMLTKNKKKSITSPKTEKKVFSIVLNVNYSDRWPILCTSIAYVLSVFIFYTQFIHGILKDLNCRLCIVL